MSTYNLGADHDSDEVAALKSKLSVKDNEIAMLKDKLVQSSSQILEVDLTLKETNYKLRLEADRRTKLEEDLERCCEERQNHKTSRENLELALNSLTEKLRTSEKVARDLQVTIEHLSSCSEGEKLGSQRAQSNLERDNNKLITRVRELEFECRQLKTAVTPHHQPHDVISPAPPDPRTIWLEQENDRLRQLSAKYEEDVKSVSEKLTDLQTNLVKAENEKVANERRMQTQLKSMQEKLEENWEELDYLRQQAESGSAIEREQQLVDRIDEDQAKIEQLEKLIEGGRRTEEALSRAEVMLKAEIAKAVEADRRNIDLVREKEEALDALEKVQENMSEHRLRMAQLHARERALMEQLNARPSSSEQSSGTDLLASISHDNDTTYRAATPTKPRLQEVLSGRSTFEDGLVAQDYDLTYLVHSTPQALGSASKSSRQTPSNKEDVDTATLQRLLAAIERIRDDRDNLKRQLEFSQMEHKFAVAEYEARAAATITPDDPMREKSLATCRLEENGGLLRVHTNSNAAAMICYQERVKQLNLALTASSVVIDRLRSNLDSASGYFDQVIQTKDDRISEVYNRVDVLDAQLNQTSASLSEVERQRIELSSRIETVEGTLRQSEQEVSIERESHRQSREELLQSQSQLAYLTKALSDVETERDSLNLQVQHLETDLVSAQQELTDAQTRYSSLQAQKLSAMSSSAANRTLKQQIEDLEARVQRRTEQIGIHQHDIRRMETNLRLQEERIAEMTFELETLGSQKEAMVEDCAEAREARDLALQQVEAMEVEIEAADEKMLALENDREKEVTVLVSVVADAATRTRSTVSRMKQLLHIQLENQRRLVKRLRYAEEVSGMAADRAGFFESEASSVMNTMQTHLLSTTHDVQQAILALAVSQKACRNYARSLEVMSISRVSLEGKIQGQQTAIVAATAQISSLQHELAGTHGQRSFEEEQARHEVKSRIASLEEQIRSLQRIASETESRHEDTVAELTRSNEELRLLADHDNERVQIEGDLLREIQTLSATHIEEVQSLQNLVDKADAELAQVRREQSAGDDQYRELQRELNSTKEYLRSKIHEAEEHQQAKSRLEDDIAQVQKTHSEQLGRLQGDLDRAIQKSEEYSRNRDHLEREHDNTLKGLFKVKEELQARLAEVEVNCVGLKQKLEEEIDCRGQERQKYQNELRCAVDHSHKTEAGLHQEIMALQQELEHSNLALETMTEEKISLETEMTNLEAEIQRSISLRQYLEKQVKEDESEISLLKDQLAHVRRECAYVEKNWSATEVQLSLQDSKYKEVVSALKRELETMRSKPNLEIRLHELKERYDEMEELLKAKCVEVEATDDKYLEVLQERRKLNTRLDNLNRKVQNLEKQLAEAGSVAPKLTGKPSDPSPLIHKPLVPSSRPNPTIAQASSSQPRPRVVTSYALTKTPESKTAASRSARPSTADRPRENIVRSVAVETPESTISIGKKRRAPDDFDACETVPPQVFTPDSLPSKRPENMTPRSRRNATSIRTGFTPVRNKPPSTEGMRRVTTAAATPSMITDVTNAATQRSVSQSTVSSVQSTTAGKRSWLRNVRAAQSTQ